MVDVITSSFGEFDYFHNALEPRVDAFNIE